MLTQLEVKKLIAGLAVGAPLLGLVQKFEDLLFLADILLRPGSVHGFIWSLSFRFHPFLNDDLWLALLFLPLLFTLALDLHIKLTLSGQRFSFPVGVLLLRQLGLENSFDGLVYPLLVLSNPGPLLVTELLQNIVTLPVLLLKVWIVLLCRLLRACRAGLAALKAHLLLHLAPRLSLAICCFQDRFLTPVCKFAGKIKP